VIINGLFFGGFFGGFFCLFFVVVVFFFSIEKCGLPILQLVAFLKKLICKNST